MNPCPFTPFPCCLQGSTWLISGLLRTLTFRSNPYGMALLAYHFAGLAGFSGCTYLILLFIYSTKGFSEVLWEKEVPVIIYQ